MQYFLGKEKFTALLVNPEPSRLDKLLLILFWDNETPKSIQQIKDVAAANGLRECQKWHISDILGKAKVKATSIQRNWVITLAGKAYLAEKTYFDEKKSVLKNDATDLRNHLAKIVNPEIKNFVEEAISCLETDQKRAAVVLSWIGAIAILYEYVISNHLAAFNAEATKRDSKWKIAKNIDDIGRLKEYEFLNILEAISVIGKNVKQELQQALLLRNSCGHPNTLKIGVRKIAAHLEILILNVYSKF